MENATTNQLKPQELRIEAWPQPKAGGMQCPMPVTGVKVTHQPTGLAITCDEHRSQHRNKDQAMAQLESLLAQLPSPEEQDRQFGELLSRAKDSDDVVAVPSHAVESSEAFFAWLQEIGDE